MAQNHKDQVLSRLRSVEGHVRGVGRMVEDEVHCVEVVKQTLKAVQGDEYD